MRKPRLLDLFCGAGGAAMGYSRAGFDVVGVDIKPQPHYPFDFHQMDAMDFPRVAGWGGPVDAVHASPPCQAYSSLKSKTTREWPDLIAAVRQGLREWGKPYVIENVMPAPLHGGVVLCGLMFGLMTHRHRRFESSVLMMQPTLHDGPYPKTSTFKRKKQLDAGLLVSVTGNVGSYVGVPCMGIDWMTGDELSEAIPPAYTEFVGKRLMDHLEDTQFDDAWDWEPA
jgi:DNA (cytosine-5)-methyltransferase 1